MKLTKAGEYAVRCVLYLSGQEPGHLASRGVVAKNMDIPSQFLGKIAQRLARHGILEIVQGAKGGLRLAVPAKELTLLDVVEAAEGEIVFNDCVLRPDSCGRHIQCPVHQVWNEARNQFRATLAKADFASLAQCESHKKSGDPGVQAPGKQALE